MEDSTNTTSWSRAVAELAVDALVDHGLLKREDFDAAVDIAADEIQIRLAIGDYPLASESDRDPKAL